MHRLKVVRKAVAIGGLDGLGVVGGVVAIAKLVGLLFVRGAVVIGGVGLEVVMGAFRAFTVRRPLGGVSAPERQTSGLWRSADGLGEHSTED